MINTTVFYVYGIGIWSIFGVEGTLEEWENLKKKRISGCTYYYCTSFVTNITIFKIITFKTGIITLSN